jgi:type III secretory pathway component EscS
MNISNTENYMVINQLDRVTNGIYQIISGIPQVFPFTVKPIIGTVITAAQVIAGMQDGSLVLWLSSTPLDQVLFTRYDWLNPVFVLRTSQHQIAIWDQNLSNIPNGSLALDPTLTYYINVKNNQAKTNTFKLIFN